VVNANLTFEFLYCFDNKFNTQAFSSIISLLDKVDNLISINIIHNDEKISTLFPSKIINHPNLEKLNISNFEDSNINFPNLKNNHVSEATYFRMFIDKYVDKKVKNIVYIDSDIICLKDPTLEITKNIENLRKNKKGIGVITEKEISSSNDDTFSRLDLKKSYFNAGVMLVDMDLWRERNIENELMKIMKNNFEKIKFWDQDVLNIYFNGDFYELPKNLNFNAFDDSLENDLQNIFFLHFVGSKKPWLTSGMFNKHSEYYHKNFRKLTDKNYHIEHKWKQASIFEFIKNIINLNIFQVSKPISYFKEFISSLR